MVAYMRTLILAVTFCFLTTLAALGQDAPVRRATAETGDGILFSVWLETRPLRVGESIFVKYLVKNHGKKSIYLVRKAGPTDIWVDGRTVVIDIPTPTPIGHGGYDYTFIEVKAGKEYRSQFIVTPRDYKKAGDWIIETIFGYVTDVSGLDRQLRANEDPIGLRGLLNERMLSLHVSGLIAEVGTQ